MFKSEFRTDGDPSCHIIMWEGDLLYKDFGEQGYRVFDYIARKFDTDYQGSLQVVNRDFGLGLGKESNNISSVVTKELPEKAKFDLNDYEPRPTIIEINPRRWTSLDRAYWKQYDIPPLLLKYHNIKSISSYRIDSKYKDNVSYRLDPYTIGYSIDYYWNDGVFRRKLYFPQVKGKGRFISNVDKTIVQGWTLLPKQGGNTLIVTKSYKDILTFNLLGYWAISPNSEHAYIPDKVMEKLKQRFRDIYVWFDNDESGIKGAENFSDRFNLHYTHNPLGEPKDPSDYVKKYSLKQFDILVTKFLNSEGHHSFSPKF